MSGNDYVEQLRGRCDATAWHCAAGLRLLTLDVDGVLTDGRLWFTNSGEELKAFSTLDGLGLKLLRRHGVEIALITGRGSQIVARRAADLGIEHVFQRCEDKLAALERLSTEFGIGYDAIGHIGDDLPDLPLIRRVGLGMTVANGHPAVVQAAHWQSHLAGGHGAVREACDLILAARGVLATVLAEYE